MLRDLKDEKGATSGKRLHAMDYAMDMRWTCMSRSSVARGIMWGWCFMRMGWLNDQGELAYRATNKANKEVYRTFMAGRFREARKMAELAYRATSRDGRDFFRTYLAAFIRKKWKTAAVGKCNQTRRNTCKQQQQCRKCCQRPLRR